MKNRSSSSNVLKHQLLNPMFNQKTLNFQSKNKKSPMNRNTPSRRKGTVLYSKLNRQALLSTEKFNIKNTIEKNLLNSSNIGVEPLPKDTVFLQKQFQMPSIKYNRPLHRKDDFNSQRNLKSVNFSILHNKTSKTYRKLPFYKNNTDQSYVKTKRSQKNISEASPSSHYNSKSNLFSKNPSSRNFQLKNSNKSKFSKENLKEGIEHLKRKLELHQKSASNVRVIRFKKERRLGAKTDRPLTKWNKLFFPSPDSSKIKRLMYKVLQSQNELIQDPQAPPGERRGSWGSIELNHKKKQNLKEKKLKIKKKPIKKPELDPKICKERAINALRKVIKSPEYLMSQNLPKAEDSGFKTFKSQNLELRQDLGGEESSENLVSEKKLQHILKAFEMQNSTKAIELSLKFNQHELRKMKFKLNNSLSCRYMKAFAALEKGWEEETRLKRRTRVLKENPFKKEKMKKIGSSGVISVNELGSNQGICSLNVLKDPKVLNSNENTSQRIKFIKNKLNNKNQGTNLRNGFSSEVSLNAMTVKPSSTQTLTQRKIFIENVFNLGKYSNFPESRTGSTLNGISDQYKTYLILIGGRGGEVFREIKIFDLSKKFLLKISK